MNYDYQARRSEAVVAFKEYAKNLSKYHGKDDISTIKIEVCIAQNSIRLVYEEANEILSLRLPRHIAIIEEANEILSQRLPQITAMLGPENEFTINVNNLYSKAKALRTLFC